MNLSVLRLIATATLTLSFAEMAPAQALGFVNNPNTNSVDFAQAVGRNGGTLNFEVNFATAPVGTLNSNLYSYLGVTLNATGIFTTVVNNAGPSQIGNTPPKSFGEGVFDPSFKYLGTPGDYSFVGCFAPSCGGTLTISFATPVLAAGLFTIDLYNPAGAHAVTLEAFTGPNGTGQSLGKFSSAPFNFQQNGLYFMGVLSSVGNIGSVVLTDPNDPVNGDVIGLAHIIFAPAGGPNGEPFRDELFLSFFYS